MGKNKSEMTVVQSNLLIESRFKLTLSETKLLLWMVKEIHPGDKDFKTYRIYIKDFIDAIDSKRPDFYTSAKAITKQFLSRVLELENGNLQIQFMSRVRYFPGDAFVEYRFDKDLKPYLIQLKRQFTSYDIRNVLAFKYSVSIRIYQLLKSFEGLEERTITIKDLRYMLMVEDEYKRFYDFKRFILERSRKELKKFSDLYFEYSLNKRGRNVHSITFTIKKQKQQRLFDNEDYIKNDAVVSYQGDATEKVQQLKKDFDEGVSFADFANDKED
jgi:plasmid replication initiation protein